MKDDFYGANINIKVQEFYFFNLYVFQYFLQGLLAFCTKGLAQHATSLLTVLEKKQGRGIFPGFRN